jgi:hypothetical protein
MSGGKLAGVDSATEDVTKGDNPTEVAATGDDTRADGGRDGTDVRWVMTPHDRTRRLPLSDRTTSDQLDALRRSLAYCG